MHGMEPPKRWPLETSMAVRQEWYLLDAAHGNGMSRGGWELGSCSRSATSGLELCRYAALELGRVGNGRRLGSGFDVVGFL